MESADPMPSSSKAVENMDADLPPSGAKCPLLTRLDMAETNPTSCRERWLMQQFWTITDDRNLTGRVRCGLFVVAEGRALGHIVLVVGAAQPDMAEARKLEPWLIQHCRQYFMRPPPVRTWWVAPKEQQPQQPLRGGPDDPTHKGKERAPLPIVELPVLQDRIGDGCPPVHRNYLGRARIDDAARAAAMDRAKKAWQERGQRLAAEVAEDARRKKEAATTKKRKREAEAEAAVKAATLRRAQIPGWWRATKRYLRLDFRSKKKRRAGKLN